MFETSKTLHIEVVLHAPAGFTIAADGDALRRLMRKVMDNAIPYVPKRGQVNIGITKMQGPP